MDDELRVREVPEVADVVVVKVGEDDLARSTGSPPRAARARRSGSQRHVRPRRSPTAAIEADVDEDRPLAGSEDVEEVVHPQRRVGLAVGVVVGEALRPGRLARAVPDGSDVPTSVGVPEREQLGCEAVVTVDSEARSALTGSPLDLDRQGLILERPFGGAVRGGWRTSARPTTIEAAARHAPTRYAFEAPSWIA